MNPHTIRRLFPNASKSIIEANAADYGKPYADDSGADAALERNSCNAPLEKKKIQGRTGASFLVRVTSVRKRLADEDGLCEKYFVDLCRYAGIIFDDAPGVCKIETSQRKVEKSEEEHTLIEIFNR